MSTVETVAPEAAATVPAADSKFVFPPGIFKITASFPAEDGEEPEKFWIQFRPAKERFKGGERKAIYQFLDSTEGGQAYRTLAVVRQIALHVVHSWSFDFPPPRPIIEAGQVVGYEHAESLDLLDTEAEDWVLQYAKIWMEKIAVNFGPQKDPESPTKPSDG